MSEWYGSKWIRPEKRLAIYIRDSFMCVYCQQDLSCADAHEIHLDHLRTRGRGGGNEATNLITTCSACNMSRGKKLWWEFAERFAGAKQRVNRQRRRKVNVRLAKQMLGVAA